MFYVNTIDTGCANFNASGGYKGFEISVYQGTSADGEAGNDDCFKSLSPPPSSTPSMMAECKVNDINRLGNGN